MACFPPQQKPAAATLRLLVAKGGGLLRMACMNATTRGMVTEIRVLITHGTSMTATRIAETGLVSNENHVGAGSIMWSIRGIASVLADRLKSYYAAKARLLPA